jgi:PilZ domain-containing protein
MRTYTERADRMRLGIPIKYRVSNDDTWFDCRILNISDSGVLFGPTSLEAPPGTHVELLFSSRVQIGTMAPGQMICVGEVVRTTEAGQLGARFDECRFMLDAI